ncbi:type IV secretory system conjugative DNA transfer family protein [Spirosoma utsteinense]|uniref:type IV secretory system conjugative DNA transfer family protein n=1 Tax=Spirosoma utsteinense TaxID=2585773 RepID=UPI0016491A3C|nr:type IV secretory system conjugative DNA transfer family protein [Spirosoma utsteinense]MBC3789186.1 hypothetical protein [Spirosoma utsteinense]
MQKAIGTLLGSVIVTVVAYWLTRTVLGFVFTSIGVYKIASLGRLATNLTELAAFGVGGWVLYLAITGGKRGKGAAIGQASTTSKTGRKVKASVYTIETHTPAIPRIYLTKPERGVLILGGAGAGKSKSLIEPIIRQTIQQGRTGLLYDFKFPTLARVAAYAWQHSGSGLGFYYVNFEDLTRSHRVNPLSPATMPTQSHADEYARAILYNLKPDAIKKGDFWTDSAHSYLTALIWFLREEHPDFCTLPHVMALAFQPTADVVALLSTNPETRGTIASLRESVQRKAEGQTAGVVSTLQTALRKINTKEIVWVLSGDDFDLNLNDPDAPKFVTLGNAPTLSNVFAPVIALLTTVALKQMNQQGKRPSALILDEAPTLFIPNLEQLPATGRSNEIATVFGAQDISQIEDMYGRSKKDALLSNLNNQFYGRVGHRETAQYISDLWGKEDVKQRTEGENESSRNYETTQGRSVSHSYTERSRIRIQDVLELQTGEFYGQLVDSDFSSFKAQIKAQEGGTLPEIVPVTLVTAHDVKQNFLRIQADVESLFTNQGPDRGRITEPVTPQPTTPAPLNGQAKHNGQDRHNGQALNGESLDF